MVSSEILIWNEKTGFIRIYEGTGDNLLPEDEDEGYVDYINIDGLAYDEGEFVECYEPVEGGMAMLTELYQEKFESVDDVIQYLIEGEWMPDVKYIVLFAN
jgi:hypothetical protein